MLQNKVTKCCKMKSQNDDIKQSCCGNAQLRESQTQQQPSPTPRALDQLAAAHATSTLLHLDPQHNHATTGERSHTLLL
jgi:hypothetical protein